MEADYQFLAAAEVDEVARKLLGMQLWVQSAEGVCAGIITETEAYGGAEDRASHAFGGKMTLRNAVMYQAASAIYVYRCYGIHHLFNIVTGQEAEPAAVLIRALRPIAGLELMQQRSNVVHPDLCCNGPGKLSRSMGISLEHNGSRLQQGKIWLQDSEIQVSDIVTGPRVGVGYAGSDALLPRRFYIRGEQSVSRPLFQKYSLQN
ncbi:MAG: DNA-3-methyladenine glycosylase [Bacteroidia bacterium]